MMNVPCKVLDTRMSSNQRINQHPAYILHSKPYRDTSLIVDILTRSHGRIAAVAKGARQPKSKFNGILQPFTGLLVSWSGHSDLLTLTDAEAQGITLRLAGNKLMAGFYLNELLLRLLQRHDPHEELFEAYHQTLTRLAVSTEDEVLLRQFEYYLLQEIGYGLILDHDVNTGEAVQSESHYCYYIEHGPVRIDTPAMEKNSLLLKGETLQALASGQLSSAAMLKEAKYFMRAVISHHLGGKPLRSREMAKQKVL